MSDLSVFGGLDPAVLAPFLLAVAVTELTPGPNMGYLAVVASRWGSSAGVATVAGITLGLCIYLAATIAGLASLMRRWPAAYDLLRWSGVAYLFWLAWVTWRGEARATPGSVVVGDRRWRYFARGLVANLLNPKAAVFYLALLPTFTDPIRGDASRQALVLGVAHVTVSVAVHLSIVSAAARIGARPASGARFESAAARAVFAAMLVLVALWIAWEGAGAVPVA